MSTDTVLYIKRPGADRFPVLSLSPDDPDASEKITATKMHHVDQAIKSGAPLPTFEVVRGRPSTEQSPQE